MGPKKLFKDRMHAGQLLAKRLTAYALRNDVIVLALPRGGVPVGYVVAQALQVPLDVVLVRKLGVPGHEEYAMGAIVSGGLCVLQDDLLNRLQIPMLVVEAAAQQALEEIARREKLYRGNRPDLNLREQTVILVDDGLATGSTMKIAIHFVREQLPARLVVAVPVGSVEATRELAAEVDEMVCLHTPEPFDAVSLWYEHFEQTSDAEVISLLADAGHAKTKRAAD